MGSIICCFITSMNPLSVIAYSGIAASPINERKRNGNPIVEPASWEALIKTSLMIS